MARSLSVAPLLVLVALVAVPAAHAQNTGVPQHSFLASIEPERFDSDKGPGGVTVITGGATWSTDAAGLYVFEGTRSWHAVQATRIEVFNQTAVEAAQQGRRVPSGPISQAFFEAGLSASSGSSLALLSERVGITYTCEAPFAVGIPMRLPPDTFGEPMPVLNNPHFVTSGPDQTCAMHQSVTTSDTFVQLLDNESSITVTPGEGEPQRFQGEQWAFKIFGTPQYDAVAEGLITPFHGPTAATFTRYDGADLAERFTLDPLTRMMRLLAEQDDKGGPGNTTETGEALPGILTDLGPILNGVVLGNLAGPVLIDGEPFGAAGYSFLRFTTMTVNDSSNSTGLEVTGQSRLVMSGGEVHTVRNLIAFGPLQVPLLSVLFWIVAAAAILGTFALRPFVGDDQVRSLGLMRVVGFLFHAAALVVAFILFDREFQTFLGTSLLSLIFGASGSGIAIIAVGVLQLMGFGLAAVFFGLPMRFVTNAAIRLGGLKGASGFGKGVGNLAIWGVGAIFLRVILGGFIAMVFSIFSGVGG